MIKAELGGVPLIEVKDLVKQYGKIRAVDHVSFSLEKGKIYGFLGSNGAGKSTTMNIMTGYLAPTEGSVVIDGYDILKEPEKAKAKIGYLPEIPPLYPEMTVREYLDFACDIKGLKREKKEGQLKSVMDLTKTEDVGDRLIRNLSKGYRQRVGLAQAILGYPEIIILDEPNVGLDPSQIIEIRELIRRLAKNHTVILSSHILAEVREVCDYILIINKGKLIASDTYDNLKSSLTGGEELVIEAEASRNDTENLLKTIRGIESFQTVKKKETTADRAAQAVTEVHIRSQKGTDPRKAIFLAFAERNIPLLTLKRNQASLEEVFMKLTSGEEVQSLDRSL